MAQLSKQQQIDSLRAGLTADSAHLYRYKKVKFLLAIDTRNSFIHTDKKIAVNVNGFQIGMVYKDHHNIALGFYSVLNTQTKQIQGDNQKKVNINLKIGYATLFYEYIFLDTKRWEIGIPIEIGHGNYHTTETDSAGKPVKGFADTTQKSISLLGVGLDATFKVWNWLGLNAMGGYRLASGGNLNGVNFNGVFYSVGLHIYFGELYRMYRLGIKRRLYRNQVEKINKK
ncbi:MAG TPA: hypothetical protein VNZ49_14565 [Bacteroidia bacterium]|nr:hypothetical protein [Bacteroidia bacterium]